MKTNLKIKQDPKNPVPAEVIADALIKLSRAIKVLEETKLNRRAIVILLSHSSRVNMTDVEKVVDSLASMETDWIKK